MMKEWQFRGLMILAVIVWTVIAVTIMNIDFCHAHENEKYKHQTGRVMQYGGKSSDIGIKTIYVNAAHTQCRDMIFSHDMSHWSEPYYCGGFMDTEETSHWSTGNPAEGR